MAKILVTGGAGFIGSNFVLYWLKKYPRDRIFVLDLLTYAANHKIVEEFKKKPQVQFIQGNICNTRLVQKLTENVNFVFHFAAETHVDRSILNSRQFLATNVLGTQVLLEAARTNKVKKFIFVSTDEVYGTIARGLFREDSPLKPNSPYAASKAAADLLCRSYWVTHRLPVMVTRCCNNFGPYQFPEKVIPLFVTNLIQGKKIPVYGKGENVREWIYVEDHCSALDLISRKGSLGEVYNVGTGAEIRNIDLANKLLKILAKPSSFIEFVKDRPGHDFRYALDWNKLKKLGWRPKYDFNSALKETVNWYIQNQNWWKKIKRRPAFKRYLKKQYHPYPTAPSARAYSAGMATKAGLESVGDRSTRRRFIGIQPH